MGVNDSFYAIMVAREFGRKVAHTKWVLEYLKNRLSKDAYNAFIQRTTVMLGDGTILFKTGYHYIVNTDGNTDDIDFDEFARDIQHEYDMRKEITIPRRWI